MTVSSGWCTPPLPDAVEMSLDIRVLQIITFYASHLKHGCTSYIVVFDCKLQFCSQSLIEKVKSLHIQDETLDVL